MKLAFLYAGQGSQHTGMGQDFYNAFPDFRKVWEKAASCLDFDLNEACFQNPDGILHQTRYTQPSLVAFAAGVTQVLYRNGIRPQAAAGLSIGEYSALYAAGVLDLEAVMKTVALRGRAMEQAAQGLRCGMTAVLGLDRKQLQQACDTASADGVVEICNDNCPGQLVISGEKAATDRAGDIAKEMGAKRCLPLQVSGPFHTSLMAPAGKALASHFSSVSFHSPSFPVYFNCKGGQMEPEDTIEALLVRQVQTGVRWRETLCQMEADGIDTLLEIGPGNVLSGLAKKTVPRITAYQIDKADQLKSVVSALKGASL
ncbi:MAG: ACP S-malonyltransferase [Oscillospiraceae bacterium]|jgi:[acyl-carrier-protein] S-malonyltransferase